MWLRAMPRCKAWVRPLPTPPDWLTSPIAPAVPLANTRLGVKDIASPLAWLSKPTQFGPATRSPRCLAIEAIRACCSVRSGLPVSA